MNEYRPSIRDRTNRLLLGLAQSFGADSQAHDAAIRHLGVAALNLATEADCDTLEAATRGLPWIGLLAQWEEEDWSGVEAAETIARRQLVEYVGPETIRRHIASAVSEGTSNIRRAPADVEDDSRAKALAQLVERDQWLRFLMAADADERPDLLIADSRRFATALAALADPGHGDVVDSVGDVLPDWEISTSTEALEVLACFEERNFETVPDAFDSLGTRARRFEQSLATHLQSHDVLPALRAALAIAPEEGTALPSKTKMRRYLARFSPLAADPTLKELAVALMTARHRIFAHLRGELALSDLDPWVTYLRGPCAEFGERRGITLREATNFAHYALHLLTMCDVEASSTTSLKDPVRRALMDVEDELKEFALVGQRVGLDDEESQLARFDDTRWGSEGLRARLADRLSRLCGAWRSGHRSGPVGTPPRPDDELYDRCLELVTDDEKSAEFDALANLFGRAQLRGIQRLRDWAPSKVLALLGPLLRSAVDAPTVNPDRPFVIDLSPLGRWLKGQENGRRQELLRQLLEVDGLSCQLLEASTGLRVRGDEQRLVVDFQSTDELDALLTLLATTAVDDPSFAASVRERIRTCLERSVDDATTGRKPCANPAAARQATDERTPTLGN